MGKHSKYSIALIAGACSVASSVAFAEQVTIVLDTEPEQLELCQSARSQVGKVVRQNIGETLTEIDPSTGDITPRLATSWTQLEPTKWKFELREGVKFHDGSDFDADALVYAIQRTLDPDMACENRVKYFDGFELTAKAVGPHTVELSTSDPVPILPTLMGTMAIMSPSTPMGEPSRAPVGTGPYVFAAWEPGQQIELERFDGYWGDTPQVTGATYVWRGESAVRAAMIETGEADIAANIAIQDATNPEMDFSYLNSETSRLRIDTQIGALEDVRVRKALNHALDREALVGSILPQDVILATQLVGPSINGHNPNPKPYSYDPALARQLLDEARADGVDVDAGIVLIGRHNIYPNAFEVMQAIQAMYADVGLDVSLTMTEAAEWFELLVKPFAEDREPNLLQSQHDNNNGDAVFTVFAKYHSDGGQSTISDAEVDRLIEEAGKATGAERRSLYQEMFARLHDEIVPDVYMFHMVGFTRVGPRLNFQPSIATNSELQLSQISLR